MFAAGGEGGACTALSIFPVYFTGILDGGVQWLKRCIVCMCEIWRACVEWTVVALVIHKGKYVNLRFAASLYPLFVCVSVCKSVCVFVSKKRIENTLGWRHL